MARLRIPPSGPFVENSEGGDADVGNGFQLRLDEAAGSTAMAALTDTYQYVTDINGEPFEVFLDNPSPDKRYKFNFHAQFDQPTGAAAAVQLRAIASYDGSTFDKVLGENSSQLLANEEGLKAIDIPMTLGSALGNPAPAPIPATPPAPSIAVRVQAKATVTGTVQIPNGGQSGTIWLSLAELL